MKSYRRVLTIAGSDSGGGAGIQADLKTISACGCYGASAITAVTVQNTVGVREVFSLDAALIGRQIAAVLDDIGADAVKIGMLGSPAAAEAVAARLTEYNPPNIVLDPVLVATSGDTLTADAAIEAILGRLMPLAELITPNIPEAEALSGVKIRTEADYPRVWEALSRRGAKALLLKGGHADTDIVRDVLFTSEGNHEFTGERIATPNTHGTGCTLSSAIASFLAYGMSLTDAVEQATAYIHHAVAAGREYSLGRGHGPVHHFFKWWPST